MWIIFYLLLVLRVGRCTHDQILETKTVGVGDDVTLTCTRLNTEPTAYLFWIRLVSGNLPEILGGTLAIDHDHVKKTARFTAKQGPGTFLLDISKTKLSDTEAYYCIKVDWQYMTFVRGIFLTIKGQEPSITAIIQAPPSDPVRPGDSVTLQCSVLPENKTCSGEHSVYWFRAGSDQSHPSLFYAHGNSGDGCEKSPETHSPQKCVYNFFKDRVSSSDAGTYYCVVATCGEILFGKGTKLDIEAPDTWDSQPANTVVFLLCAALALSLIVIAFLINTIMKKSCGCCKDAAAASGDQRSRQREEESLVYSAPTFTGRKAGKAERRNIKAAEGETVYSDVQISGFAN